MSKNTDIVSSLISLGLSEREAKVYRVLLGIEEITASAIPKFADVPRTKVYEVLTSLQKKGFCRENTDGNILTYSAVDPKLALESLMRPERERLRGMEELSSTLKEEMGELYNNSATRLGDYEFIEILKGHAEIVHRYNDLRSNARDEIIEMSKGDYFISDEEAIHEADANAKLIDRGVRLQVLYERSEIEQCGNNYFHTKNHELGVSARMVDELPIKMSLFGGNTLMLPLSDPAIPEPNTTALIIEHPELYKTFKMMFRVYWDQATEIDFSDHATI
ncbi:TrmB family transcriptional regulator [uncultured Porphyromonas sp.]|uniref:TrmB family transcriptional regulator n=1 Tax=uncultured Porphyromonas sp. TaxID=159274 RepID=UPI002610A31F|nr:helix-turn-helix domain-containing protein [uncultured Porphyromonas sp.]